MTWDEYFIGIAELSAQRSKDPNTQVGACIVSQDNKILSLGYNGMPIGCSDDRLPWSNQGDIMETKYLYVCHAELNAILNSDRNLAGAKLYTTLFPCNECAKAIIQAGIRTVIYRSDKYSDSEATRASKIMFDMSGVQYYPYEPHDKTVTIDL